MIKIADYGMGNLRSVQKAFEKVGAPAEICDRADDLVSAQKLVLPGVGAFGDAMRELQSRGMVEPVLAHVKQGKPFLGICLGLQLLFDLSHEEGEWPGLGVLAGEVVRFEERPGFKVPHMGWNQLQPAGSPAILQGIPDDAYFYFVHSYHVVPKDENVVAARTEYGDLFVSMVARDNLVATQFHPEKSQQVGLKLLANFAAW